MGNERTLAGGGRGRWFQFILWVLPTRSSLSNPVGRSVGRPAALLFLSLPPTRANVLLLPPTLPSRVPFVFPPRGFYCSPCFFQGHFSSIFLSSFEEEEFPSFFSPLFILVPRFPNTESFLSRADRIDDDTWMNRKDF